MFTLVYTGRFKKDVKLLPKGGYNMRHLKSAIIVFEMMGELPAEYKPHKLSGNFSGYWEAHLKSDWLIIWQNWRKRRKSGLRAQEPNLINFEDV